MLVAISTMLFLRGESLFGGKSFGCGHLTRDFGLLAQVLSAFPSATGCQGVHVVGRAAESLAFALRSRALSLISDPLSCVCTLLSVASDPVSLVSDPVSLVSDPVSLVSDPVSLVNEPLAS
ncbi:hypothetical protein BN000_04945 [Mycobacterium europaeum]|uniref:Uncharacterized protein n=1 Tax=Mycobacterium europaeum TaxID=761804 RepID=A0A0U1DRJ7_9MYCO|nr:hypothetical protein [Mycobacterium europaeum]ORV64988.1 hypothetical protein AWC03_03520 [Mycobacterium europaeum]CQD20540.1 hypothetical protein BN000_04945 [Mycobacterium europaeum]